MVKLSHSLRVAQMEKMLTKRHVLHQLTNLILNQYLFHNLIRVIILIIISGLISGLYFISQIF